MPAEILGTRFFSVTRTNEEVSIVCDDSVAVAGARTETGWGCIKVLGPLDFSLTGILSQIASPLAREKISVFAISTFDTDYILVKELDCAVSTLKEAGFPFI